MQWLFDLLVVSGMNEFNLKANEYVRTSYSNIFCNEINIIWDILENVMFHVLGQSFIFYWEMLFNLTSIHFKLDQLLLLLRIIIVKKKGFYKIFF